MTADTLSSTPTTERDSANIHVLPLPNLVMLKAVGDVMQPDADPRASARR
jgi:hypothetical protein